MSYFDDSRITGNKKKKKVGAGESKLENKIVED